MNLYQKRRANVKDWNSEAESCYKKWNKDSGAK